ncbi:1411_t:CDS:2, partial [Acaulospora morrowiae]
MDVLELVHVENSKSESRPFCCTREGCNKAFARRSDLSRHDRIHTKMRCMNSRRAFMLLTFNTFVLCTVDLSYAKSPDAVKDSYSVLRSRFTPGRTPVKGHTTACILTVINLSVIAAPWRDTDAFMLENFHTNVYTRAVEKGRFLRSKIQPNKTPQTEPHVISENSKVPRYTIDLAHLSGLS